MNDSLYLFPPDEKDPQKYCSTCKLWKPLSDFYDASPANCRKVEKVYKVSACKTCFSAYSKRRYGNLTPEQKSLKTQQRRESRQRRVDNTQPNKQFIDHAGEKYGHLTILSSIKKNKRGRAIWECQCDCGRKHQTLYESLRSGKVRSCGCTKNNHVAYNKKPHGESSFQQTFAAYKKAASSRGYVFDLESEYFRELTQSNCYYCNQPPSQKGRRAKKQMGNMFIRVLIV
jgi:hypothetical protein